MTGDITRDDHLLARDLAEQAGRRLVELRARGGDPDVLRKAGDRLSHQFLTRELAARRPGDVVLSEEGADDPARLSARRVWIVDPLDGTREFGEPGPHRLGRPRGPVGTQRRQRPRRSVRRRGRAPRPGQNSLHGHRRPTTTLLHRCCYNDNDVPSWR